MSEYDPGETWAWEQDAADPLAWTRQEFELPTDPSGSPLVYLAGNSLGAMPRRARALIEAELEDWSRLGVAGHLEGRTPWYSYHETVREPLARLAGARPHEVVAMNSLTVNLHLLLVSLYQPTAERYQVLVEEMGFPSDAYAIESHLATRGIGSEAIRVAGPGEYEQVLAEEGQRIALVWLSAVHYYTGHAIPVDRLTRAAHAAGCRIGLDCAHAIGNLELRLHEWDVDFAVWCSYKYLNAGPGAVGGAYLHERYARNPQLPRYAGWWGNDPASRFAMQANPRFRAVPSADGWQVSNPPILSLVPLRASLDLFERAGLPALRQKSLRLTGYLEFLLERTLGDRVRMVTPRDPASRGCQLSVQVRKADPEGLVHRLGRAGVVTDFRDPDVIRVAPVPLYNTFHDVWRFVEALRSGLG